MIHADVATNFDVQLLIGIHSLALPGVALVSAPVSWTVFKVGTPAPAWN